MDADQKRQKRGSLPTELFQAILKLLPRSELLRLRVTSRVWRDMITPLVFDRVQICIYRPLENRPHFSDQDAMKEWDQRKMDATLTYFERMWGDESPSGSIVGPHVRSVRVQHGNVYRTEHLVAVLRHCPNVTRLSLHNTLLQQDYQHRRDANGELTRLSEVPLLVSALHFVPLLENLTIEGELRPLVLEDCILPHTPSLRHLRVNNLVHVDHVKHSGIGTTFQMQGGTTLNLNQLAQVLHHAPDMESLSFMLRPDLMLPASFMQAYLSANPAPGTPDFVQPWLSLTSLFMCLPGWPVAHVPDLLSYICLVAPNLKTLKMDRFNNQMNRAQEHAPPIPGRDGIDPTTTFLPALTSFEYQGSFVSVILDVLHMYTVGPSGRTSTLEELRIKSLNDGTSVDLIKILEQFPALRTLHACCFKYGGWWTPNGNDIIPLPELLSRLPLTHHAMRTLTLEIFPLRHEALIAISKMCPNLTSVFLPSGSPKPLPLPVAAHLPLDAFVDPEGASGPSKVKWVPLPFSRHLKHAKVPATGADVFIYLATPKMPDDDTAEDVDAPRNVSDVHAWYVERNGSEVVAIHPLGRDAPWLVANLRPSQNIWQKKDADLGPMAITALNAARQSGINIAFAPSQLDSFHLGDYPALLS
ncbi:hypothetical protein BC940DRAFT_369581 [Gongronella butleri]|nr:hypothetical protein BC940DRAFT_369581 [Gongronella butleri]